MKYQFLFKFTEFLVLFFIQETEIIFTAITFILKPSSLEWIWIKSRSHEITCLLSLLLPYTSSFYIYLSVFSYMMKYRRKKRTFHIVMRSKCFSGNTSPWTVKAVKLWKSKMYIRTETVMLKSYNMTNTHKWSSLPEGVEIKTHQWAK